jgi:uncharacterized protein YqeY
MTLHNQIREEMKEAMRAKDAVKLSVVRGLLSAFTNEAIAKGKKPDEELSDEDVLAVIRRQAKQRNDSIEQFEKGGRPELAESEKAELSILEDYLPALMPEEEVMGYVEKKKAELGISDKSGAGQLTGAVMKELKGKADGAVVKAAVDKLLS